jgi:Protein of unknown function (DUF1559)
VTCPSFSGSSGVAVSQFSGSTQVPTAYGGSTGTLGSAGGTYATVTNYLALTATHYPCMQYGSQQFLTVNNSTPTSTTANTVDLPNGTIVPGTGLNLKTVTDGASRTLIICETVEPCVNSWYDGTTTWTTAISPGSVSTALPSRAYSGSNPLSFWYASTGTTSCVTALNVGPAPTTGNAYAASSAQNGAVSSGYSNWQGTNNIAWGPSSNHSGGVVLHGAADASVHNITTDVDPGVYMHIMTRAGREPDAFPDTQN